MAASIHSLSGHSLLELNSHSVRKPKLPTERPTRRGTEAPGLAVLLTRSRPRHASPGKESSWKRVLQPDQASQLVLHGAETNGVLSKCLTHGNHETQREK